MSKYSVLINPSDIPAWTGYVHAEDLQEANRMAAEIADKLGGNYLDIKRVYEVDDAKKHGTGPLTGDY